MGATVKWYQNVDGVEGAVFKDPKRKDSKFWGQGKWDNFIVPLLPNERQTFVEIGCNAGMFLKLAMDAGFKRAIGIEADPGRMEQAKLYRESNGYSYKLVQQKVGGDFRLDELPLADVVLFSNVHYYFPIEVFSSLVDHLRSRTLYCIVVSARANRRSGAVRHYLDSVRGYFKDWREIKVVGDFQGNKNKAELMAEGDPTPRTQMYGVVFKGCLDSCDVDMECAKWDAVDARHTKHDKSRITNGWREFFTLVLSGEDFNLEDTSLYECWMERSMSPEWTRNKLDKKRALIEDVRLNGFRDPIFFDRKGRLLDGMHRLCMAKALGYQHILCRRH